MWCHIHGWSLSVVLYRLASGYAYCLWAFDSIHRLYMSAIIISAMVVRKSRHYQPENKGQMVQLANWPFSRWSESLCIKNWDVKGLQKAHLSHPVIKKLSIASAVVFHGWLGWAFRSESLKDWEMPLKSPLEAGNVCLRIKFITQNYSKCSIPLPNAIKLWLRI